MNINRQLACLFQQMADVHTILGDDRFRINAYTRAARTLDHLPDLVTDLEPSVKTLTTLEGIGKSTASKIMEYLQTGRIEAFDLLMARIPPGLLDLLNISGLGPKTIATLWHLGGIESLAELKEALKTDELEALPRLGKKTLDKLRHSIAFAERSSGRVLLGVARPLAIWFVEQLQAMPGVERAQYAGSLRRGCETIGDLDLLVAAAPHHAQSISNAFCQLPPVREILAQGQTKTSVRIDAAMQVDLRIVHPNQFAAALMYFTGSQAHNVAMRQRAIRRGMRLNEYGLTRLTGDETQNITEKTSREVPEVIAEEISKETTEIASEKDSGGTARSISGGASEGDSGGAAEGDSGGAARSVSGGASEGDSGGAARSVSGGTAERDCGSGEEGIYEALGLAWIAPELREDHGELALAENNALPRLIEVADLRAELHAHTHASDGTWSIRQFALYALEQGYHSIAVTDHSKGQAQANGLSLPRLEQHIANIRQVADEFKDQLTIYAGSEVDILADGSLDYPDSLLAQLDIVIASPHAALSQEPDKATDRLLRAIENPYVTVIGHPTGRLINRRAGLSPDMSRVIQAARTRGIALEINASYHRLDLNDHHARMAIEAGVKLAINTDAHAAEDIANRLYGVLTARRAGATREDVVNCLERDALAAWIASTRSR